jgi:proteasome lid subunit RPN8/RPN11
MERMQPVRKLPVPLQLHLAPHVLAAICETIGTRKAESGGILGGCRETGEVTDFFFDETPRKKTGVLYSPNTSLINEVKKTQWQPQGIDYLGSIHSHPPSFRRPSTGDEVYARRILEKLEVPYLLVPIVTTLPDTGSFSLHPFAAVLDEGGVRIIEQELVVGGNLIRPAQPHVPDESEAAEEYLAILMELNMTAMLYGGPPRTGMLSVRRRQWGHDREERNDYD